MNLARFALGNLKAILFVTVVLCLIGGWTLFSFPVAILPDVTFPRLVIIAEAGELPARRVEVGVSRPLEEAIATVPGVARLRSKIQRGAAELSVDFSWGTDMLVAEQLVSAKVNEARTQLPTDTQVTVERMNPTVFPILGISLRSKNLSQDALWSLATYKLKPILGRVPGVARAVVQGGRIPEILVEADPNKLAAFHLALPDLEQALAKNNVVRSVGRLDIRFQQYQALVSGEATTIEELNQLPIATRNGVVITLGSVTTIQSSTQDRTTIVTADGAESVLLNIVRQPDANTVSVVAGVQSELTQLKKSLPPGTELGIFYDQSVLIGEAIASVRDAVLIGAGLAVVVLLLFLGDMRATLVTALIIPVTVLITFLLMRLCGLTLNLMTLGALAIGVGLVIDDAIVVVENVFRHLAEGAKRDDAVQQAATQIAAPMISSTLTTVVVFLPLTLVTGVAGAFFTALAVTLTIALLVSLALALTVSPSLCAAFLKTRVGQREHSRLFEKVLRLYERILRSCLRQRVWLLPLCAVLAFGGTVFFGTRLGTGFMPTMDEGAFILDYVTAPGTSLAESDRLLKKIEEILTTTPEVKSYSRRTGTELGFFITEPNTGDFAVVLKSGKRRDIEAVIEEVRGKIAEDVPGIEVEFVEVLQDLIGDLAGAPEPVEIKLFGEDQKQLEETGAALAEKLAKVTGVADMKSGVVESGPELTARVNPLLAGRAGLSTSDIGEQVGDALFGIEATKLLQGDRQVGVRVRYPEALRSDAAGFGATLIKTPLGAYIPLSSLATLAFVPGTSEITREDQRRMMAVTAQLEGRDLGSVMRDISAAMRSEPLPVGVTYVLAGQYQSQQASFANLMQVLALAVLLVFAVMVFQFKSFTAPVTILLILPLALFGVALGLWITNTPLNVSSLMGAVMLVGIVVKNGILLLDQAQHAESEGLSPEEAVILAGERRLRPILMTTLTALLGLVPLALGIGAGAQLQKPLAVAVIGGLTCSTLFTLVLAPLLYVVLRQGRSLSLKTSE
ncbi:efflux RND transporter permease subunit [Armatimonas sp.]|uniref:efflux RND transporter permease subunit n=1 Tax=Armatimonas sp. TaxID=1872638 RepID=UPI00286CCA61|nr:efflux RND transporter permease subunit [Armatimonas sp.]